MKITADFPTERAAPLMGTMAKHFGHKIPVSAGEDHARLQFEAGLGIIEVTQDGLRLTVEAASEDQARMLRGVLESHLLRFAHREDPQPLTWAPAA